MSLQNLDPTPGADKWNAQGYPKLNAAINKINDIDAGILGGTTGQVLKKSSNSNYAYAWSSEQSISGKADKTQLLIASISAAGPTSYPTPGTDTVMLTLIPSASKAAAVMKYTFMGYLSNNVSDTAIVKIKKNGTEIASTKTTVPNGQANFCLTWIDTYTANDSITATVQPTADGGDITNYILICESLNAV